MSVEEAPTRRRLPARAGIAALNLFGPGLGLFRTGDWRAGILFLVAQLAFLVIVILAVASNPISDHASAVAFVVVAVALAAAIIVGAIVLTWRKSAIRKPAKVWSRWYSLIAIAVGMNLLLTLAVDAAHGFYRPFYLPTRSMDPTIGLNDRIVADMDWRGPYQRGQIVMFRHNDSDWIKRIAALPGDRIAMRNGVPVINGSPALQVLLRKVPIKDNWGPAAARVYRERFPGEPGSHLVQDTMTTAYDDTAEIVVPHGHLFVLGDNRDHSADSRVPAVAMGAGPVPISAVTGRALFISWGSDRARTGHRLDR